MTPDDVEFFKICHQANLVKPPILDIGSAKVDDQPNIRVLAGRLGIEEVVGADLAAGPGVDWAVDFGLAPPQFARPSGLPLFSTVCIFNVLEHTFDPSQVLSNALSCVADSGSLLVLTPAIWPIHNYPGDFNRMLPDWYREFARRHDLQLVDSLFCWLSEFGIEPIGDGDPDFPTWRSRPAKASATRYWVSRIGHRLLHSYGRSHWGTHCAIGAAFLRRRAERE